MVEGQLRQLINREPCGLIGIIPADHLRRLHQRIECYGYHALARVAIRVGENAQLHYGRCRKAGLLAEFPKCAFHGRLIVLKETTGKRPLPFIGFSPSFHQKDLQLPVFICKDDAVRSDGGVLVLVLIRERRAPDKCVILTHSKGKFSRFVS